MGQRAVESGLAGTDVWRLKHSANQRHYWQAIYAADWTCCHSNQHDGAVMYGVSTSYVGRAGGAHSNSGKGELIRRNKMTDILLMTFSNAFTLKKNVKTWRPKWNGWDFAGIHILIKISFDFYTPAPPKVEWGYTGFTPMSVRPFVRPSVHSPLLNNSE